MIMAYIQKFGLPVIVSVLVSCGMAIGGSLDPSDEVVIVEDTLFSDRFPGRVRVKHAVKTGSGLPAVPMVDLDTSTYEKRLWLSEKRKISNQDESKNAKIVAVDSIVFTGYWSSHDLMATYSIDFGHSWTTPDTVQWCGDGHSLGWPLLVGDTIAVPYSASFGTPSHVLIRGIPTSDFVVDDSVVIHSVFETWEYVMKPRLAQFRDTVFVCYNYRLEDERYVRLQVSTDAGNTWVDRGVWLGPGMGTTTQLLITDTVMSLLYDPENENEVRFYRSLDRGMTWEESDSISMSVPPSNRPAAATDGVSGIHASWYDFESLPPDATGGWVYYRRSLDAGESWEDVRCLSTKASSEAVEICANTDYVYACWSDARYGSPDLALYFRYSHDGGSSWSPEIQIVDETDPAWDPDVYAQGDLIYIVWHEQHPPDWVWEIQYILGAWYLPGDVDLSEVIDIADLVYMVDWMFTGGPAPIAYDAAQMDGLGTVDIADLVYIVDYMFNDGPAPIGGAGL